MKHDARVAIIKNKTKARVAMVEAKGVQEKMCGSTY
jgi:hypothetical protein